MPSVISIAVLFGLSSLVSSVPTCADCEGWTTRSMSTPAYLITDFKMACTGGTFLKCTSEAPYSMIINYTPPDASKEEQGPAVFDASCSGLTGSTTDYVTCDAPYSWVTTAVGDAGYVKIRMEFEANGHRWNGKGTYSMDGVEDGFLIMPDLSRD
ncbi:hypothetical protein BOTCAL_0036g00130 [Botryotinia calthae]|uniref:Cyanovirin-N domain-containing protein n=1 Tax=Botryotinia calthae TaxID=38488 RepID=A0A4Y8DF83_9HELO|nr:hypothetical protein BOTCAL_0036g00130 [Botryotinia calthae]